MNTATAESAALYRLADLMHTPGTEWFFVTADQQTADAITATGAVATYNPNGPGSWATLNPETDVPCIPNRRWCTIPASEAPADLAAAAEAAIYFDMFARRYDQVADVRILSQPFAPDLAQPADAQKAVLVALAASAFRVEPPMSWKGDIEGIVATVIAAGISPLTFLQTIHGDTGFLETRCFTQDKNAALRRQHFYPLPLAAMPDLPISTHDCYHGAAPRFKAGGTANDVQETLSVWLDVDFKCFANSEADALAALHRLGPLAPSIIAHSGHGLQPYWLFREPTAIAVAIPIMDRLRAAVNPALDNVSDAPRILRIPGTFNHKNGENLPVRIVYWNPARQFNPDDFDILPKSHPTPRPAELPPVTPAPGIDPAAILAGIPAGKRNDTLFRYACSLANRVPISEATILLRAAAAAARPPYPSDQGEESPDDMVRRVYSSYRAPADGLPTIRINDRPPREIADAAIAALHQTNEPPTLFCREIALVRVIRGKDQRAVVSRVGEAEMRERLTRAANFAKVGKLGAKPANPPPKLPSDLLAADPQRWPFPALVGVIESPALRPDGTIIEIPGYDAATRLYYAPDPTIQQCPVPANPTVEDARQAAALLEEVIGDFPFAEPASKANALALPLTPIIRPAVEGCVPIGLIDAPKQGSGKSLLAELASLIATGRSAAMMGAPRRDDDGEWNKIITGLLTEGATVIVIDNIEGTVRAPSLCRALTCSTWLSRLLGTNTMLRLPQRATWIGTGNNLSVAGDLPRRCYWVRIDPKTARPEQRTGFRHPDLLAWAAVRRAELLAALLTMARAWFLAGRPPAPNVPAFGSFESWVSIVGGILAYAGVEGFLDNQESFRSKQDEESVEWENFLWALDDVFGEAPFRIAQIIERLDQSEKLLGALPSDLTSLREAKPANFSKRLAGTFRQRDGTRYGQGGIRVEKVPHPDAGHNVALWRVTCDTPSFPPPAGAEGGTT